MNNDSKLSRSADPAGYLSSRTIVAPSTAPGGALTVVRLSGPDAFSISERLTSLKLSELKDRHAYRARLTDFQGAVVDDAVLIHFKNPRSFTGEDVVEFSLHGGSMILQKVIESCTELGARLALPGEFSFRSVRNGKMTLSQAESVNELIQAENDFALAVALEKLSGSQHILLSRIREELTQVVTLGEVGIDFADQDVDEVSLPRLKERVQGILQELKNLQGSFDRGRRGVEGINVSIFGLPNAGKSSFFNALLGEDRSIVSDIAGTTRDVLREKINLKGNQGSVTFRVADTAGLRKNAEKIEEIGIERSIKTAKEAELVVVVVDGLNPQLVELKAFFEQAQLNDKPVVGVISKGDLNSDSEKKSEILRKAQKELGGHDWTWISSATSDGVSRVAEQMVSAAAQLLTRDRGEVVLTQWEHLQAVEKAVESLENSMSAQDEVLFASDLRHTMNDLAPLLGETIPDDILGKIFSDFCIGK